MNNNVEGAEVAFAVHCETVSILPGAVGPYDLNAETSVTLACINQGEQAVLQQRIG